VAAIKNQTEKEQNGEKDKEEEPEQEEFERAPWRFCPSLLAQKAILSSS